MNNDTRTATLPTLTTELLSKTNVPVDNLFSTLWSHFGFNVLLKRYGFQKRSGIPVNEVVYLLLLWVWLKVDSIAMFSRESLQSFSAGRKDVMYDLLKREDLNWRQLQLQTAKKVIHATDNSQLRALVVDDTVKPRRGKKMPGVSSHYDHLTGRFVMGQQVLTLGLATEAQFVPLDSEIFISNTKAQGLPKDFVDGRSIVAKRYRDAKEKTKPEMLRSMIGRAVRADINASYFLSDAWFATKPVLQITEDYGLTGVVRMKRNKMKYRITTQNGKTVLCSAAELYKHHVKGKWYKASQGAYQTKSLTVELNMAQAKKDADRWVKVKLLFVRGANDEKQQPGKHDWALFLSTDSQLDDDKMLELYAWRWGIEVYFKEAKQHLGFLSEQSTHYSTYIASIHLTAIRFCMLLLAKHQENYHCVSDSRHHMASHLCTADFACRLWCVFRALISGALAEINEFSKQQGTKVLAHIDHNVNLFLNQVTQMDNLALHLETENQRC